MKAMILAAGLGTRLQPYSKHTPKPLFTINQRPVLDITIEKLIRYGCSTVIINTHQHHTQIEAFVAEKTYPIPVHLRHEPQILGTGGAIRNVADLWTDSPLLIINGDVVSDLDLLQIYNAHQQHAAGVTMVMHHHPAFNSVRVDDLGHVIGFEKGAHRCTTGRCLAFTGIHILDRKVLEFLPAKGPAHIITAYERMLAAGEPIQAHLVENHYWQDIGTPARYQSAAYHHMAPDAFAAAVGKPAQQTIHKEHLSGDGSDRQWYRLRSGPLSLIMVDHGIRRDPDIQAEVDAYVDIGNHLKACKAAVPKLYLWDRFAGLVFMEDMGDQHLAQAVCSQSDSERLHLYKRVIDGWLHLAMAGYNGFDSHWTHQSACYDVHTILEKECRYFVEAFLQGYLGWSFDYAALAAEFNQLAEAAINSGINGLMHRDLQSRNIMLNGEQISFIDFQGARPGPLQYDLASLLIDPYVGLSLELQSQLLAYCAQTLERQYGVDPGAFVDGYGHCILTRNLQILGAFSFLSKVKKKAQFETYIPLAMESLHHHLSEPDTMALPLLQQVAEKAANAISQRLHQRQSKG